MYLEVEKGEFVAVKWALPSGSGKDDFLNSYISWVISRLDKGEIRLGDEKSCLLKRK